jgi:HSP20 family molecular chaperone IbpA
LFDTKSGESKADKQATIGLTKTNENQQEEENPNKARYWLVERSFGEFSRTFNFPHAVQQDNVTASLKDGILTVSVPKAKRSVVHRIEVS